MAPAITNNPPNMDATAAIMTFSTSIPLELGGAVGVEVEGVAEGAKVNIDNDTTVMGYRGS